MTLERDPEIQQVISALLQIAYEPHRFSDEFRRQALVAAAGYIELAYPKPRVVSPVRQSPGQLDIHHELRAS